MSGYKSDRTRAKLELICEPNVSALVDNDVIRRATMQGDRQKVKLH